MYMVTKWDLLRITEGDNSMIKMVIILKRRITNELLLTFLPSLLLVLITYTTTFYKEFFFEAGIGANMTPLLMLTTIFINKMETLPATHIRGKCSVTLLNETESLTSYLNKEV